MATSANDLIANATALTAASGTISNLDNTGAGVEAGEPNSERIHSLWFKFVITALCGSAHFDQIGSGADLYMLLYRYVANPAVITVGGLQTPAVIYDDDAGGGGAASFTVSIPAGFYFVKWASYSAATTSAGRLNWSGLINIDPTCTPAGGGGYASIMPIMGSYSRLSSVPATTSGQVWPR